MDFFDILTLIGGLCLFLFGMNIMSQTLRLKAGQKLDGLLNKLTTRRSTAIGIGFVATALMQSSSATSVLVVSFVNSALMNLSQAINVMIGANVGATVTPWLLSLSGISSASVFLQLLKPSSFTPILALIGVICYMFSKKPGRKDIGMILLGFATLMYGMEIMSGSVTGLRNDPGFHQMLLLFENPILGVAAGLVMTLIVQSSSASIGILQALSATGQISVGAAVPLLMGANIGTCITAVLSSVGGTRNGKRVAIAHVAFNVIGTVVFLAVFCVWKAAAAPAMLGDPVSAWSIAMINMVFKVLCMFLFLPFPDMLERLAYRIIPHGAVPEKAIELDEHLLATPPLALERCQQLTNEMAEIAFQAMQDAIFCLWNGDEALAKSIRDAEERTDHYEDVLGSYLVKVSAANLTVREGHTATKLLKLLGDFERIADHALNIVESRDEIQEKGIAFTGEAQTELSTMFNATREILRITGEAYRKNDINAAMDVEPLEQVIDELKETLRTHHILRMQKGSCSIEAGFVWSDLLTNLERVSDHCSNVAGCVMDDVADDLNLHETVRAFRSGENNDYRLKYREYKEKYAVS